MQGRGVGGDRFRGNKEKKKKKQLARREDRHARTKCNVVDVVEQNVVAVRIEQYGATRRRQGDDGTKGSRGQGAALTQRSAGEVQADTS